MAGAQTSGWFSLWGEAGYSRLNDNMLKSDYLPKVYSIHGFGAGLGIGYEFHYRKFIAMLGIEGTYWNQSTVVDNFQLHTAMIDTEGDPFEGVFDLRNNTDHYNIGYANIPLMVGFHLPKKWYFLVGAKYGLNILGQSATGNDKTTVTSSGIYPQFIDVFVDMPNHEFWTYKRTHQTDIEFENNLAASLEVGKYLSIKNYLTTRIALFADYGFLNIHKDRVEGANVTNDPMPLSEVMRPEDILKLNPELINNINQNGGLFNPRYNALLLSQRAYKRTFTPLFIGLKLTVQFKLHENNDCMCEWY
jgi:hypothetical protein